MRIQTDMRPEQERLRSSEQRLRDKDSLVVVIGLGQGQSLFADEISQIVVAIIDVVLVPSGHIFEALSDQDFHGVVGNIHQ